MINLLVFGSSDHASRIARLLNSPADDLRAAFIRPRRYASVLVTPRSDRVVIMRAGLRFGSATVRGRLFDGYWSLLQRALPDAVACHYWLGTDVLDTVRAAETGTLRWDAISSSLADLHLAVAPWLSAELESVGLHAITALLPPPHPAPQVAPPLPTGFSVLAYAPAVRFDYYGGQVILEAARRMPDVRFDIVGGTGERARTARANVQWHGWVDDMAPMYAEATVVVRIPQHDGSGNTVIEGLLYARYVVYTQKVPFVRTIWPATAEALVSALRELQGAHAAGQLGPNLDGRAYALDEFEPRKLADRLMALVRAHASPNPG